MNIKQARNAIYVGKFVLDANHDRNHIRVEYSEYLDTDLLKDSSGRVYIFSSDGIIKKIGGSASKGGIKSTLSLYTSSMTGSPGKPRFILHLLIRDEILSGKKVEIHMINARKIVSEVKGLFSVADVEVAAFQEMEDMCRKDYISQEKCHPDWNFKENNQNYPSKYVVEHNQYHEKRIERVMIKEEQSKYNSSL